MEAHESITTITSIVVGYVVLGVVDALYCRFSADDVDASGDISVAEYDAFTAAGIHRLFSPIHTIMKGVFGLIWPFVTPVDLVGEPVE